MPPAVQTTLRFRDGDAALDTARVTLPARSRRIAAALSRVCPAASFAAGTCPATSRVGTATATSPLTPIPLTGPVRLVENPGGLPIIGVDLGGVIDMRLQGTVDITADGLVTTFTGAPDLPLSTFTLALDGGSGGIAPRDRRPVHGRCASGGRRGPHRRDAAARPPRRPTSRCPGARRRPVRLRPARAPRAAPVAPPGRAPGRPAVAEPRDGSAPG